MNRKIFVHVVLVLSAILMVSCGAGGQFQDDNISVKLSGGWSKSIIKPATSYVLITTSLKDGGNSLSFMLSDKELNISDVVTASIPGGMMITGVPKETSADVLFKVDNKIIPRRDVEVEEKRLRGLNIDIPHDQISSLAEINIMQMTYFMVGARDSGITVSKEEINKEIEISLGESEKTGTPRELFLMGWGITQEEFREIIKQKLIYSQVVREANNSYMSLNEAESATKYLTQLGEEYLLEYPTFSASNILTHIIEFDNCFLTIEGVSFSSNQTEKIKNIINSISIKNKSLYPGIVYIFSPD